MAELDSRVSTLEGSFKVLMETLANQLSIMNERISDGDRGLHERLNDLRAWLIALTALAGVQLAATITVAMAILFRR